MSQNPETPIPCLFIPTDVPEEAPEKTFSADKDAWNDDSFEENGLDEDIEDSSQDWY